MQLRDLVAQLAVLGVEFADALVGEGESLPQRGAGSAFDPVGGWCRRGRCGGEPSDVVAEFGLGVEPGAGDAGAGGDVGDRVALSGFAEFPQGALGAFESAVPASLGGGEQVVGVVRTHRMFLFRSMFRRMVCCCSGVGVRGW